MDGFLTLCVECADVRAGGHLKHLNHEPLNLRVKEGRCRDCGAMIGTSPYLVRHVVWWERTAPKRPGQSP